MMEIKPIGGMGMKAKKFVVYQFAGCDQEQMVITYREKHVPHPDQKQISHNHFNDYIRGWVIGPVFEQLVNWFEYADYQVVREGIKVPDREWLRRKGADVEDEEVENNGSKRTKIRGRAAGNRQPNRANPRPARKVGRRKAAGKRGRK